MFFRMHLAPVSSCSVFLLIDDQRGNEILRFNRDERVECCLQSCWLQSIKASVSVIILFIYREIQLSKFSKNVTF